MNNHNNLQLQLDYVLLCNAEVLIKHSIENVNYILLSSKSKEFIKLSRKIIYGVMKHTKREFDDKMRMYNLLSKILCLSGIIRTLMKDEPTLDIQLKNKFFQGLYELQTIKEDVLYILNH